LPGPEWPSLENWTSDMTDQPSSDPFDRAARAAGEALRRPAPADGAAAVRSVRRRQRLVLGAAGVGALALLVGAAVLVATRGGGEQAATVPDATLVVTTVPGTDPPTATTTLASTTPATTTPTTTTPTTSTSTAPTTSTSTAPAAPTTSLVEWADAQSSAGRTTVDRLPVEGGDAVAYLARQLGAANVAGAVALPDGRVVEMPTGALPDDAQEMSVFEVGGRIVVVLLAWGDNRTPSLSVLDPVTLLWSPGPDLGFGTAGASHQAWWADGSLLMGHGTWMETDTDLVVGADREAVIVRPDLSVVQVDTPPDGVQTTWSSVSGHTAFSFGYAGVGSAYTYGPYPQPWSLDVATNEWAPVPNPDWMTCAGQPACDWRQPTEGGVPALEVATDVGLVKLVPDGSVGVYDPDTGVWRRIGDPPFELTLPTAVAISDHVVVAPSLGGPDSPPPGAFTLLDVVNGIWYAGAVELAPDDAGMWQLRHDGDAVLLTRPRSSWPGAAIDTARDVVVDTDTPTGRVVSEGEVPRWYQLAPRFDLTVDELG